MTDNIDNTSKRTSSEYFTQVYEYHIQRIQINKVSGAFQVGELMDGDLLNREGLHRIFVNEILVGEIGGSGSVGIGLSKKGIKKKKKLIPPEKADQETNALYDEIKVLLNISETPIFFQKLAIKKPILNAVIKEMKQQWNSPQPFDDFYNQFKKEVLANSPKGYSYVLIINQGICEDMDKEKEGQVKTILVIIYFLQLLIPGYLDKYLHSLNEVPLKKADLPERMDEPVDLLRELKKLYKLKHLPKRIKKLKQHPVILTSIFNDRLRYQSEEKEAFINKVKQFMDTHSKQFIVGNKSFNTLDEAFFFSTILNQLKEIPYYLLFEKITKDYCEEA